MIGKMPTFVKMNRFVRYQWLGIAAPKLNMLGNGVCLFSFPDKECKDAILDKQWTFYGFPLILRPWTPDLDLENLSVTKIHVWVRFPKLQLSLWNPEAITRISSFIGTPLAKDKLTAIRDRLDY